MTKTYRLYNLHFSRTEDFEPFSVAGYTFSPLSGKQPTSKGYIRSQEVLAFNRKMHLNAKVYLPSRQRDSVLRTDGRYSEHRKIKFLYDLLVVTSLCIGQNVVPRFWRKLREFPLHSKKHCAMIAFNSEELETCLEPAVMKLQSDEWRHRYENGFHIRMFYNSSNVPVSEPRFLANVTIWEYLFYCDHRDWPYDKLASVSLDTKIRYLAEHYMLPEAGTAPEGQFRAFCDIRNQLSHSGRLPIENPKSPFQSLGWNGCKRYMRLFTYLTQALVLQTLGIDALDELHVFGARDHLEELVANGFVQHYRDMDEWDIDI
jgi:hypothetical protein